MLNDDGYEMIRRSWQAETRSSDLQDLEDFRVGKMISYLSGVRIALASNPTELDLQAELLTNEILNLEFMVRDFLMIRRKKIVIAAMEQRKPLGTMTLAEEDLFNRLIRGFENHDDFVREVIAGTATSAIPGSERDSDFDTDLGEGNKTEYVLVRFLKPVESAFVGIDETTYGPFKKEDVATIPTANARKWLRDGTVMRITVDVLGGG